jgi:formate hydrogenlyase subunit 6/NADH:ubiquinone oxidoreductase subunit I
MSSYFQDLKESVFSVAQGLSLTFRHLLNARNQHDATNVPSKNYFIQDKGIVTLSFPYEQISVPDNGRYKLYNEIDDCIVCDKCAVVCPVNCIEIETIKSSEAIGETSDGSIKRLYASKFNIDMAKCFFCGLCTSVCPTECLTMTNEYDFSEFDVKKMDFPFSNMTPEQADEKKKLYEQFLKEKEEAKIKAAEQKASMSAVDTEVSADTKVSASSKPKMPFKPTIKPPIKKNDA